MAVIQIPASLAGVTDDDEQQVDPEARQRRRMRKLLGSEITPAVQAQMEAGGFFTEGFTGGTVGEYSQWFQQQFGFDPIAAATTFSGGKVPSGITSFFGKNPLGFTEEGFTGIPETERGFATQQFLEQRMGLRREEEERERGIGMLNWLMGQAAELSGTQFAQLASIAGPLAQERLGFQAGTADPSGILGVMSEQEQQRIYEQERKAAAGFDFTQDLLPSLITGGLAAIG